MAAFAAVPQGLASAFIQAPAPPGLKLNLRKEEKQEVVAMCCLRCSAGTTGKTGHRGFFAGVEDGNPRLLVPNLELKFT